MTDYQQFHRRSIEDRDGFWAEQAQLVHWNKPAEQVCDYSKPPFVKWFKGGETNLCYNAVDRHAATRPNDRALVYISTETDEEKVYSFAELQREVERMAAIYQELGVQRGDRVLIYMPMIAEAAFAMLACARIGAIHSVVFGGFAAGSLATRIDDAKPVLMVSSDAGMRNGKPVPYKHLVDEACKLAEFPPAKVLIVDRGLDKGFAKVAGRDVDYAELRARHMDAQVPVVWLESSEPSYILYTSGTTGKPKGVQRDDRLATGRLQVGQQAALLLLEVRQQLGFEAASRLDAGGFDSRLVASGGTTEVERNAQRVMVLARQLLEFGATFHGNSVAPADISVFDRNQNPSASPTA